MNKANLTISTAASTSRTDPWSTARAFAPFAVFAVLFTAISAVQPAFLVGTGPSILLYQSLPVLVLALGQTVVLMTGSIDLSNAALTVLACVLVATGLEPLGAWALVATIIAVSAAGLMAGVLITLFRVPSFAVTLGLLGFWLAIALLITQQKTLYIGVNGGALFWLTDAKLFGLQPSAYVCALLTFAIWFLVRRTRFGAATRATGLNELGATLSGIDVKRTKILAFGISGLCAGIAGILITSQQGTASASGLGNGLLLPAIAAAVLGGISIGGGVGNPLNVIFGALIVTIIPIGSAVIGFDTRYQQFVFGIAMIVSVGLTIDRKALSVIK